MPQPKPQSKAQSRSEKRSFRAGSKSTAPFDRRTFTPERLPLLAPGTVGALAALWAVCDVNPRRYQQKLICGAIQAFAQQQKLDASSHRASSEETLPKSIAVDVPVGGGKTFVGLCIASLLQRSTGCKVGWFDAATGDCKVASDLNRQHGLGVRMQSVDGDLNPTTVPPSHPAPVNLLVLDNAHHLSTARTRQIQEQCSPFWTLGLTSFAIQHDRLGKPFDRILNEGKTQTLIDDGFLSRFHHFTINKYTPHQLATLLIGQPERFGKSIVYFDRQRDGELLYLLLRQAGVRAAILSPKQNRSPLCQPTLCQSTLWTDLRESRIDVLIHAERPIRTFDCPDLKTVFCKPAGKTATRQMTARVFQKSSLLSVKQVVQCTRTSAPVHHWVRPERQFLLKHGAWVSDQGSSPCDHPLCSKALFAPPNVSLDRHRIECSPVQRS